MSCFCNKCLQIDLLFKRTLACDQHCCLKVASFNKKHHDFFQELAVFDKVANNNYPHPFLKKVIGIMQSPPSVMLSPPQPLDEIKGSNTIRFLPERGERVKYH